MGGNKCADATNSHLKSRVFRRIQALAVSYLNMTQILQIVRG